MQKTIFLMPQGLYLQGYNALEIKNPNIIKFRFWVNNQSGIVLGEGRVRLLEKIIEEGSISKAAKSLNISYKKAWGLINGMNQSAVEPLVIRLIGGKGGGGTQVTTKGQEAIKTYRNIQRKVTRLLQRESNSIKF